MTATDRALELARVAAAAAAEKLATTITGIERVVMPVIGPTASK